VAGPERGQFSLYEKPGWLTKQRGQAAADSSSLELATTVAAATENQMPCMKPNPFCFLLSALCLVTATATAHGGVGSHY
jgi:hypothetical protein